MYEQKHTAISFRVNYLLCCQVLIETRTCQHILVKIPITYFINILSEVLYFLQWDKQKDTHDKAKRHIFVMMRFSCTETKYCHL